LTRNHAVNVFEAAVELRSYRPWLRPLVHWFLPTCRLARAQVAEARSIIGPVLEQRRAEKSATRDQQYDDALEWFEQSSKGAKYDPVAAQLLLSMAAIHTTTDLTTQVLFDLAQNQDMLAPLREEITRALREGGWKKTSLYNMKLLDSVIKESQRLKPISSCGCRHFPDDQLPTAPKLANPL
jgi:cytochrome P450